MVERGAVLLVGGDLGDRHRAGDVKLAGAERALLGVLALDGVEEHFLQLHLVAVPIGGAPGAADVLVGFPLGEDEVAVAHEIAGAGPGGAALIDLAEFFDGRTMERIPRAVAGHRREIGDGMIEREDEGVIVRGAHSDLGGIGDLLRIEGLAVFEGEKEVGVFGGETGREEPAVGENEIVCGHRIAIRPFCSGAQMKGPRQIVGRDLPALGDGGHRLAGFHVVLRESLEEGLGEIEVLVRVDEVRVEVGRLGQVAEVEDLVAVAELDGGARFGAAGGEEGEAGEQGDRAGGDEDGAGFHAETEAGRAGKEKATRVTRG